MVNTIIFSYDRSLQLEVLLKSIIRHSQGILSVSILYSHSDEDHGSAYDQLIRKYAQFSWIKEKCFKRRFLAPVFPLYWHNYFWWIRYKHNRYASSDFRSSVLEIIRNTNSDQVMFLTDDSMFFRDIVFPEAASIKISDDPSRRSFSLRHGANLFGGNHFAGQNMISWDVYKEHDHPEWKYPFSVDGHIYDKNTIEKICKKVWFKNPNTMEGNIACYVSENRLFPIVHANPGSCLVGFELNRVQNVTANHHLNIDSGYLNSLFNKGYSLQIDFDSSKNKFFRPLQYQVSARKNGDLIPIVNEMASENC